MKTMLHALLCRLISRWFVPKEKYDKLLKRNVELAKLNIELALKWRAESGRLV